MHMYSYPFCSPALNHLSYEAVEMVQNVVLKGQLQK